MSALAHFEPLIDRIYEAGLIPSLWPALRTTLTEAFATRTRDHWAAVFRDHDACVTPVLDLDEATRHEQAVARGAYQPMPGYDLPQPAALLSTPDADTKAFRLYHADGFVDLARGYHFPGDARPFAILGARLPLSPAAGDE